MTARTDLEIVDFAVEKRLTLEWIVDESFEGWYQRHARRTLRQSELVRVAVGPGGPAGLAMLKRLDEQTGYVFYIAVARAERRKGVGGLLLWDALRLFGGEGKTDVYASVEEDNEPSLALFESNGFSKTSFGELAKKHGPVGALRMYREMLAVPGEVLLHRPLSGKPM